MCPRAVFALTGVGVGVIPEAAAGVVAWPPPPAPFSSSGSVRFDVYWNDFEFVPGGRMFGSTGPEKHIPPAHRRLGNGLGASNVIWSAPEVAAVLHATSLFADS